MVGGGGGGGGGHDKNRTTHCTCKACSLYDCRTAAVNLAILCVLTPGIISRPKLSLIPSRKMVASFPGRFGREKRPGNEAKKMVEI